MEGVSERTIGEILGHKTAAMTRRYSHVAKSYLAKAVEVLDEVQVEDDSFEFCPDTPADSEARAKKKS